ncbi:flippase [bacterium]|nr:flippase [bacterium]
MNTAGKIISNSTILMTADVAGRVMRFVLVIFAARLLGDVNYGKFAFAIAFTSLFLILADGGIHQLLVRELSRWPNKVKKYLGNALVIKFFLGAFTLIIIYLTANLTRKPQDVLTTVYIIAFSQIVNSFSEFFKSVFQAFQQMKYDAISTLIGGILTTGLGIGILVKGGDYISLAWMYLIANLVNLCFCVTITFWVFTTIKFEVDLKLIKFFIKEGFPFGVLYFFAMMYTLIDTVMLSLMVGDEVVGWYNAAYRLVFAMLFIPMATMKAVFPVLSKYYKESVSNFKRLFEKTFKVMFVIGFSLAVLVFPLSNKIISFIYGEEYLNAANALRILVWSTALIFITTVMTHTTRASNRQQFTAKVVASGALCNVVLNFILIPRYSYIGAALATLATELFTFTFHYFYLWHNLVKPPLLKLAPRIIIINSVMLLYVISTMRVNILFVIPTALLINFIMALLIHYFSKEEIILLKDTVKALRS